MRFLGTWNALTNAPALVSSVGTADDYYAVGVAGRTRLDDLDNWKVGDHVVFSGGVWTKVNNQPVASHDKQTLGAAGVAAVAALLFGTSAEGTNVSVIDEIVTTTNAVENNLTNTVPAGAVILSVQGNLETLIVGDGTGDDLGVKVGIGVTADPDKYGITSALTKNLKIDTIPDWAVLSGAETVCVKLAKTAGAAATEKFVAGGKVRVRIVYLTLASLANA